MPYRKKLWGCKMIKKLVVASHNQGKINEIRQMLAPYAVEVIAAKDLNLPDVEETGTTFAENAALKAEMLSQACGLPCLADDSGLCVEPLNGRPGVYSARYAEKELPNGEIVRDFEWAMDKLISELQMQPNPDWKAYFACVLAYKEPHKPCRFFEGRVEGHIVAQKSGSNGFGFDPIFKPDGYDKTFANFTAAEKSLISHRGRAFAQFIKEVFQTA